MSAINHASFFDVALLQPHEWRAQHDDSLLEGIAGNIEAQYRQKISELERIKDYQNALTPEDLYAYQTRASEYNLTVSLYSALTRKAVSAIDTVVRA
ncbi:type III secretion system inner rod subunit SctI [Pantoea sp. Mb-10]|uniref:type III secretion system inner rod subunit SctI n=1 Tax=unclassified Pantoea TaxID=2630326 RepID=UPI001E35AA3E|nr:MULTISPECIES: type III secretion system inner rod subunit SctI [unclassified Pantoea]MCE0489051.1 type III secretion system inner rod subunit SctI [Pantoea sp. Mb-10]MCE0503593.1 type III secretion system inner rod subunit SctI [Pantoea sp. Pb-8]